MWDDQFAAFAQDYQVVRYDIRGFGRSALPQIPYTDREDLAHLLTFLGLEKSYLLGFSLGGGIALDFTLEYPERADALILVGSPVNGALVREVLTEEEEQALRIQQQLYHEAKSRRNIPDMVEALMNDPTLLPSPEYASARKQVHEYLSEYSFVWVLDPAPQQPLDPPAWGRLHEIAVPTLLVVGEKDDIALHRFADKLEREISGVKRITMAGTHHLTNMEKPEEFNALVLDFLKTM